MDNIEREKGFLFAELYSLFTRVNYINYDSLCKNYIKLRVSGAMTMNDDVITTRRECIVIIRNDHDEIIVNTDMSGVKRKCRGISF